MIAYFCISLFGTAFVCILNPPFEQMKLFLGQVQWKIKKKHNSLAPPSLLRFGDNRDMVKTRAGMFSSKPKSFLQESQPLRIRLEFDNKTTRYLLFPDQTER